MDDAEAPHVVSERIPIGDGVLLHVRLHRPAVKNAMSSRTWRELTESFEQGRTDAAVLGLVLSGGAASTAPSAPGADSVLTSYFTAGADLADSTPARPEELNVELRRFISVLQQFPKLLIVAVNGHAVGAGVTMLPYADIVFVVEGAEFWTPFTDLGIPPELGSSLTLPLILGPSLGKAMLFAGRKLRADEALAAGLVAAVLPATDFLPAVLARATEILTANRHASRTIELGKRLIRGVAFGAGMDRMRELVREEFEVLDERVRSGIALEAAFESMGRRRSRRTPKL
jgi:enoyl-CoA hydratase/carnithine racemase